MTDAQAKAQAKKRFGAKFYVRNNGHFSSPERRAEAAETQKTAREEIARINKEIADRLAALDWYREARARVIALHKQADAAQSDALRYRFAVGKSDGMFTTVLGSGDTWEEAFQKAEGKTF